MFAEVYNAADHKLYGLNASGWAPAAWTRAYFAAKGYTSAPPYTGIDSATVPGAVDGRDKVLSRLGTMKTKQVLAPAIRTPTRAFR